MCLTGFVHTWEGDTDTRGEGGGETVTKEKRKSGNIKLIKGNYSQSLDVTADFISLSLLIVFSVSVQRPCLRPGQ